ncbi:hypothetical protein RCL_jg7075.t1 [Rhizophagus clarus]|uniref:Uncharacterized protein n=1 Tax=Rhizophagus clarus TaxID=94130 RepID=A0A8H3M379_9GLOM|nr:hypothetical protein RCL_jg7075.t1 [Rhizophagus clarus]
MLGAFLENYESDQNYISTFPTATHISNDDNAPLFRYGDIVVTRTNFPNEIHNEDTYYIRLMAGFYHNNNETNFLPISIKHSDLEVLLFSNLFPDGVIPRACKVIHTYIATSWMKHKKNKIMLGLLVHKRLVTNKIPL